MPEAVMTTKDRATALFTSILGRDGVMVLIGILSIFGALLFQLPPLLVDIMIIVNIAGFDVTLVRDGARIWNSPVVVGTPWRKSPIFRADLKYLVFNPTWTVPPGILRRSVLPAILEDRAYLTEKNMVLKTHDGAIVDPDTIDWETMTPAKFRYMVVQKPGPWNSLGEVKFIFPNSHYVFLHDSPDRHLFGESQRTFSSGCIRVQNPHELAALLLDDKAGWKRNDIDKVVNSAQTKTVFVSNPLPVLLLYWTVVPGDNGAVTFINDVYDRDGAVLKALNSPFKPTTTRLPNAG